MHLAGVYPRISPVPAVADKQLDPCFAPQGIRHREKIPDFLQGRISGHLLRQKMALKLQMTMVRPTICPSKP